MKNLKTLFTSALTLILFITVFTSCNKEEERIQPIDQLKASSLSAQAEVPLYVIDGQWWSPRDAANWPKVYVDLSGSGAQSLSSTATHQVVFSSHVNGNISPATGFSMEFIDKSFDLVQASDWNAGNSAQTLGRETANTPPYGWYTYNTSTLANDAIVGRTVLVRNNTTGTLYAIKLIEFSNVSQTGSGPALLVKADANIAFKLL